MRSLFCESKKVGLLWTIARYGLKNPRALCDEPRRSEIPSANRRRYELRYRNAAAAIQSYEAKDYEKAITEFSAAYELDPKPALLISIGRCHYRAGRPREALTYYNRALHEKPDRREREEATASIASATLMLQEQDRNAAEQQRAADQAKHEAQLAALVTTIAAKPQSPEQPLYKKGWFWGVVAGSVAVVGLSIGLGLGLGLRNGTATTIDPVDQIP